MSFDAPDQLTCRRVIGDYPDAILRRQDTFVITSYSIHYTKLYDDSSIFTTDQIADNLIYMLQKPSITPSFTQLKSEPVHIFSSVPGDFVSEATP